MREPESRELIQLLHKCWMTHDGMWFYQTVMESGIEAANKTNKAANRALAAVEIKRVMKLHDLPPVTDFDSLKVMADKAFGTLTADFMEVGYTFPDENVIRMTMGRCFAIEGMKRIGVAEEYECGIFSRVEGWFDALGLTWEVEPKVLHCMQLAGEDCYRNYRFTF